MRRNIPVPGVKGGALTLEQLAFIEQQKAAALERKKGLPSSGPRFH